MNKTPIERPGWPQRVRLLGEILAAGSCVYGADGLAHLHLKPATFLGMWLAYAAALVVGDVFVRNAWRLVVQILVGMALAMAVNRAGTLGWTIGQLVYVSFLGIAGSQVYRWLVQRSAAQGHPGWEEPVRLVLAGAVGVGVVLPFLTDHVMGGTDAQWYGQLMLDFLAQAHAGVFPIFTGQTEYQFNGAIHPVRSAPFHLWFGGVLDLATFRSLSALAIQHLTVVLCSLAATLGMYLSLSSVAPTRRWTALAIAAIFACCPSQLAAIYSAEAYMTFMAYPWIVLALHGNLRTFERGNWTGWWCLMVGLALAWLSHPQVGVWTTFGIAGWQLAWLGVHGRKWREWRALILAALGFVLLVAYYLVSMSETMGPQPGGLRHVGFPFIGLAAAMAALWWFESRRWLAGFVAAAAGVGLLWWFRSSLGIYASLAVGFHLATVLVRRWVPIFGSQERRAEWVLATLIVAGFLAPLITGTEFAGKLPTTNDSLFVARESVRQMLRPVPHDAVSIGGFQPGAAVALLLVFAVTGSAMAARPRERAAALAAILFTVVFVPWPRFAEFFWGNLPNEIVTMTSIAFDRRMLPALVPLVAVAGFIGLGALDTAVVRRTALGLLVAVLPWTAWETAKFVRRGAAIKGTWAATKNFYRVESMPLRRFAYDLLKIPPYLSHGVQDYRIESRILNQNFSVRYGPEQYARSMETPQSRVLKVTGKTNEPGSAWLILSPALEIRPGEDWVMRFEFTPGFPAGYLIMPSSGGPYREYLLPSSGYGQSFGMSPGDHGVLTLRNTGSVLDRYGWEFKRNDKFAATDGEGNFARVIISNFDSSRLPVRVTSLLPYRASLELDRPGWLETFRSWIPGYVAKVNGSAVPVRESPNHLVMVAVPPGASEVEVRFAGTMWLWLALVTSALAWLGVLAWGAWRRLCDEMRVGP